MCSLETDLEGDLNKIDFNPVLEELKELETDELIQIKDYKIKITKKGRAFVRNVCMALDLRLQKNKPQRQLFSMTI